MRGGLHLKMSASVVSKIDATDISDVAIDRAKKCKNFSNIDYFISDIKDSKLHKKNYDYILALEVFNYLIRGNNLLDLENIIQKISISIKPGRKLILVNTVYEKAIRIKLLETNYLNWPNQIRNKILQNFDLDIKLKKEYGGKKISTKKNMKSSYSKKTKLELILFDFHNTLSNSLFYTGLEIKHSTLANQLGIIIFKHQDNADLIRNWMRGKYTYKQFNKIIAKTLNCSPQLLDDYLKKSIYKISLNKDLLSFAKQMKKKGTKIAIFTDNMDPFTKILVPYLRLNSIFDGIFSSWEYKMLKADDNGKLIDIALDKMQVSIEKTLLIDDWDKIGIIIKNKGGHSYLYKNYFKEFPKFSSWFNNNFSN